MSSTGEATLGALLIVAVAVLGVQGTLGGPETSTLLGTLSGYIFGRHANELNRRGRS